jgi:hypothetical protein
MTTTVSLEDAQAILSAASRWLRGLADSFPADGPHATRDHSRALAVKAEMLHTRISHGHTIALPISTEAGDAFGRVSLSYVSPDAMGAAAAFLSREWGQSGYRLSCRGCIAPRVALFDCVHSDGSRFRIVADSWGNTHALPDDDDEAREIVDALSANACAV